MLKVFFRKITKTLTKTSSHWQMFISIYSQNLFLCSHIFIGLIGAWKSVDRRDTHGITKESPITSLTCCCNNILPLRIKGGVKISQTIVRGPPGGIFGLSIRQDPYGCQYGWHFKLCDHPFSKRVSLNINVQVVKEFLPPGILYYDG